METVLLKFHVIGTPPGDEGEWDVFLGATYEDILNRTANGSHFKQDGGKTRSYSSYGIAEWEEIKNRFSVLEQHMSRRAVEFGHAKTVYFGSFRPNETVVYG